MIIIVRKKHLKNVLAVILIVLCTTLVYNHVKNITIPSKSKLSFENIFKNQLFNNDLESFIDMPYTSYNEQKYVEIFDIGKGEVIKKLQTDIFIQKEANNCLNGITSMVTKVKAFPDSGYIMKVQLLNPAKVSNEYIVRENGPLFIEEVFILLPEQGEPYLMLLDNKGRPEFYCFKSNIDKILSLIQ